jgi:nitroreductase
VNTPNSASPKHAKLDFPVHELIASRWSPYAFDGRAVSAGHLCSLFEAARWAASSYNEQPWSYFVATREDPAEFERLLSCLLPANQAWAKAAPVSVLGAVSLKFARDGGDNRAAVHDLGLASANLVVEATVLGLSVHQMIGILPDRARELYRIPAHVEAWTAMAIGYRSAEGTVPAAMRERDLAPRGRKALDQFVFSGAWARSSPVLLNGALPVPA